MNKIFEKVNLTNPKYSAFDLSREQKLSCRMGELVPTYLEEIIPGDQFMVDSEIMVRFAPMLAPLMHRVDVFMHYFFVPNRLLWSEWEDFITGGKEGTAEPIMPNSQLDGVMSNEQLSRLGDYLGLPNVSANGNSELTISRLPARAYQLIWNEYYRDPNLEDEIDIETAIGTDLWGMRYRAWQKDYFTSALPFLQRGVAIGVPIEANYKTNSEIYTSGGTDPLSGVTLKTQTGGITNKLVDEFNDPLRIENLEDTAMDFTINELRKSSALQRWLEKSARGGYRYTETILAQFGVKTGDERLQRPEYLGGGKTPVVISEVVSTAKTLDSNDSVSNPVGELAGHGISMGKSNTFKRRFTEHGYVMGIMSIVPKPTYQQGLHRHWTRNDRFDYAWPELANLGEQEVKNREIYYDNDSDSYNNGTFGYQQRYAEYKHGVSTVHGDFRESLDFWHLGRKFATRPNLNGQFTQCIPDDRIFAVTNGSDHCWVQLYHKVRARRPLPYFADPKLI